MKPSKELADDIINQIKKAINKENRISGYYLIAFDGEAPENLSVFFIDKADIEKTIKENDVIKCIIEKLS